MVACQGAEFRGGLPQVPLASACLIVRMRVRGELTAALRTTSLLCGVDQRAANASTATFMRDIPTFSQISASEKAYLQPRPRGRRGRGQEVRPRQHAVQVRQRGPSPWRRHWAPRRPMPPEECTGRTGATTVPVPLAIDGAGPDPPCADCPSVHAGEAHPLNAA